MSDQALEAPVRVTGTVNTAPWHEVCEALLMATEPDSVKVAALPAATSRARPVWLVKVTPVEALHAAPASLVMVPLPETAVTRTGYGLGLLIRRRRSPVAPG